MFFLAATLVGWIEWDFVYRKVAAKNIISVITMKLFRVRRPPSTRGQLPSSALSLSPAILVLRLEFDIV